MCPLAHSPLIPNSLLRLGLPPYSLGLARNHFLHPAGQLHLLVAVNLLRGNKAVARRDCVIQATEGQLHQFHSRPRSSTTCWCDQQLQPNFTGAAGQCTQLYQCHQKCSRYFIYYSAQQEGVISYEEYIKHKELPTRVLRLQDEIKKGKKQLNLSEN